MTAREPASLRSWLTEPLPREVAHSVDVLRRADDVQYVAVMPDVHLATDVCVGLVLATDDLLYPAAVGNDIGCGMAAIAFDAEASLIDDEQAAARVFEGLYEAAPSNKHRQRAALPDELKPSSLCCGRLQRAAERDGCVQLGTLGRGNHFIEFQADEASRLWLMVHSGSRGVGQLIAQHHAEVGKLLGDRLACLAASSEQGHAYLADLAWARSYARENRLAMLRAVESLMRRHFSVTVDWTSMVDLDHNYVERQAHFGQTWWVHRKGAQAAGLGQLALIPGSMGTASFHVSGRGVAESLLSCSHGAGRQKSRFEARKSIGVRELTRQMGGVWFDHRRANALRDEAPAAYKDVRQVMRAQSELVRIERELRPVLSYKGV